MAMRVRWMWAVMRSLNKSAVYRLNRSANQMNQMSPSPSVSLSRGLLHDHDFAPFAGRFFSSDPDSEGKEEDRHFSCLICQKKGGDNVKTFLLPRTLSAHISAKHGDEIARWGKTFHCTKCHNVFKSQEDLDKHKPRCVMYGFSTPDDLIRAKAAERLEKKRVEEQKKKEKEDREKRFNQYNQDWEIKFRQEQEALKTLKYTETGEWMKLEGGHATVGITDETQQNLGRIGYVILPEEGDEIKEGESFAAAQGEMTVLFFNSPVSGRVTEINQNLHERPGLLNASPYGEGWLIKVEVKADVEEEVIEEKEDTDEASAEK